MPRTPTQGILYIAAGEKYIRAACQSAKSVLKHCPGLATHLFADWQNYEGFSYDENAFPFASVEKIPDPHRRSKVDYLPRTPFDRTLYLDTDTKLNTDIREMFSLLDRFDIALNHAHLRYDRFRSGMWRVDLPKAFPQFNGGVVLYRKTPQVIKFMEDWRDYYKEAGFQQDQMTLRELLWLSDLRIATLPPEYNVRFLKYHFLWSRSEAQTRIFHLQMYHDGPFWFIKNWSRKLGRTILSWVGTNPGKLRKMMKK
jgi:lipopolysaccharide biosynthesis glycosyltransferase